MKHKTLLIGMSLILVGLTIVHFTIKPESNLSAPGDTIRIDAGGDIEMQKAFDRAQRTLNDFLNIAETQPDGTQGYSLKVGITEGDNTEFFWVYPFETSDTGFNGRINDEPKKLDGIFKGEVISFNRGQIVDWTYDNKDSKTLHGNFTGCVQVTREAPDNAEQFMDLYGLNCDFLKQ